MSDCIKNHFPHPTYYPNQEVIVDFLSDNIDAVDCFLIEAPPGVGKTAIVKAVIEFLKRGDALTQLKRLQEQYKDKYGFLSVMGRSNFNCLNSAQHCSLGNCIVTDGYECAYKPGFVGEDEINSKEFFAGYSHTRGDLYWKTASPHCPYWQQKMNALNTDCRVHNYTYYIHEINYAGDFGSPNVLVGDECHNIESVLMNFVSIELTKMQLDKIGVTLTNFESAEEWIQWSYALEKHYIPRRLKEIEAELNVKVKNHMLIRERDDLISIQSKLKRFLKHYKENPNGWMILPHVNRKELFKVEFKPLFVHEFAKPLLFKDSKKLILMSGTILNFDIFAEALGLDINRCATIKVPSPFHVENRLIYKANLGFLDSKSTDPRNPKNNLDEIAKAIDIILSSPKFCDVKGIIHTTTYELGKEIVKRSSSSSRFLTHADSGEAQLILKEHEETDEPTILVSPSMTEGVDLKDDLSRIQICIKVPYINTMDPIINARRALDLNWYYCKTGEKLFQSMARSTRTPKDWSTTIMFDSRFSYFINKQLGLEIVPDWILDATRTSKQMEEDLGFTLDV